MTSNSDYIPYKDSKLTRILQESLGGNYKTSLIVACSPHSSNFDESISSLKFAQRVKMMKNKVHINVKQSYEELQKENSRLKKELEEARKKIEYYKNIFAKKEISLMNYSAIQKEGKGDQSLESNNRSKDGDKIHSIMINLNDINNNEEEDVEVNIIGARETIGSILSDKEVNVIQSIEGADKKFTFRKNEKENEDGDGKSTLVRKEERKKSQLSLYDLGFVSKKCNMYEEHNKKIEKIEAELAEFQKNLELKELENNELLEKVESLKTKNHTLSVSFNSFVY